jgi:DNA-binding transcriptional MocR family regulator
MPLQRKQEVYAVACEYDLLILEDDPYYILQFRNGPLLATQASFLAQGPHWHCTRMS